MNHESTAFKARSRSTSGRLPFLMFCDKEILYHGFLCFASIVVTVTQATVLNFFIIAFFRGYYHQVRLISVNRNLCFVFKSRMNLPLNILRVSKKFLKVKNDQK